MPSARKTLPPLTGLRFVAALYVFIFHIHIRWPLTSQPQLKNILDQGAIGMSLFFMLSGFVLAYSYTDEKVSIRNYFVNRLARIYPVYLAAALVTLPWIGLASGDGTAGSMVQMVGQVLLLAIANIFVVQAWFPNLFPLWNIGASWSISVEVFCYLLLPLILPALVGLPRKWLVFAAVTCWLAGSLPGLIAASFPGPLGTIYYSMPIFRGPEFVLGALIFLYIRNEKIHPSLRFVPVSVSLLLLLYMAFWGSKLPFYIGHSWIVLPCIAFVISGLSTGNGLPAKFLSTRALVWLGKTSYCFYSFQALLIFLLIDQHSALVQAVPSLGNNLVLLVASFGVLVCVSAVGYYWLEEPARKWTKRKFSNPA